MASQYYSQDYGIQLIPVQIQCPACYLNGLGESIGDEIFKGAVLNERWQIRFFLVKNKIILLQIISIYQILMVRITH